MVVRQVEAPRGAPRPVRARVRPHGRLGRLATAGGAELAEREKAHESLDIGPLSEAARDRYVDDWQQAERRFVDDPELATREADRIVRGVLDDRGYPNDDFDTQAAAVSVDHPNVVARYRHGHEMLHGNGANGEERTENLRKAMVDFRAVFEQLVEPQAELAER